MKESYRKELAAHPDPESCGVVRKDNHEALTGADAGEVLSREIRKPVSPTLLSEAEGHVSTSAKASLSTDRRGRRPSARIETSSAGTGRPQRSPRGDARGEVLLVRYADDCVPRARDGPMSSSGAQLHNR